MVYEINLDSILALEKQIEHERTVIRLKHTWNSLLNISTLLPPEILGNIFCWNIIPDGDFGGLSKGLYNFLLVCHHWFKAASHTPELWCSWAIRYKIGHIGILAVEPVRLIWRWKDTQATDWTVAYATHSKLMLHGIPYDEFTSRAPTQRNFSIWSSPQSSTRGRKFDRRAWSRS